MPSRIYKTLIAAALLIAVGALIVGFEYSKPVLNTRTVPIAALSASMTSSEASLAQSTTSGPVPSVLPTSKASSTSQETAHTQITTAEATFVVNGNSYPVAVTSGETIASAMQALEANGSITYTEKEYPGLGEFIESIDRKGSANNYYWMLYVNGVQSQTGVSETTLSPGDVVAWKYEN